jgi:hypothetical protein
MRVIESRKQGLHVIHKCERVCVMIRIKAPQRNYMERQIESLRLNRRVLEFRLF